MPESAVRRRALALHRRLVVAAVLWLLASLPAWAAGGALLLDIQGAIGPAQADYVRRGIERAAADGRTVVILRMDTPGGLDTSMRTIIKAILASPVPVTTWVAPGGARAASAGTYILYASHVAAMAPGTNLGAATPVAIGMPQQEPAREGDGKRTGRDGTDDATTTPSTRKQVNDAAAYIRGLAQMRGRNAEWAEQAVREAVSLASEEALRQKVIDLIAADLPALLAQVDGRKVQAAGREVTLSTRGAAVETLQPDWRTRVLSVITDPGIALLLMTIGIYGLVFEFMNPGMGLPGVAGAICLLLALYALQLLPVDYAGMGLIVLGLAFMVAEAFLPSFGVLGLGGVIAFVIGAMILIDTDIPGFGIPPALILSVALASAALLIATASIALKTRRKPLASGDALTGQCAEVVGDGSWVRIHGETWRIRSSVLLRPGQKVRVVARQGLVLDVVPLENHEQGE